MMLRFFLSLVFFHIVCAYIHKDIIIMHRSFSLCLLLCFVHSLSLFVYPCIYIFLVRSKTPLVNHAEWTNGNARGNESIPSVSRPFVSFSLSMCTVRANRERRYRHPPVIFLWNEIDLSIRVSFNSRSSIWRVRCQPESIREPCR